MKKIIYILILIVVIVFIFPKSFTSSPGFVTPDMAAQFEATKKQCAGVSVITNKSAMAADAPGKSLCFGWLY